MFQFKQLERRRLKKKKKSGLQRDSNPVEALIFFIYLFYFIFIFYLFYLFIYLFIYFQASSFQLLKLENLLG